LARAGAIKMELANQVSLYSDILLPELIQYGVKRFAITLEDFVKISADNSGVKYQLTR